MKKVLISCLVLLLLATSVFALDISVGVKSGYSFLTDKNDTNGLGWNMSAIPVEARGEVWFNKYLGATADVGIVIPINFPKENVPKDAKIGGAIAFELNANVAGKYDIFEGFSVFAEAGIGIENRGVKGSYSYEVDGETEKVSMVASYNFTSVNLGLGLKYEIPFVSGLFIEAGADCSIPVAQKVTMGDSDGSINNDLKGDDKLKGVFITPFIAVGYTF